MPGICWQIISSKAALTNKNNPSCGAFHRMDFLIYKDRRNMIYYNVKQMKMR